MSELPAFMLRQREFAAHIRDPEHSPAPLDVEDRRMAIYRDLFFNNVREFLAGSFPVLRELYDEPGWTELARDYFSRHQAHTPLFPQIPGEFLQYLEEERGEQPGDPPFLRELAHYEWVELALNIDTREPHEPGVDPDADLMAEHPVLSPLAWPLAYRFPVHTIGPDYHPEAPPEQPTYLIVFRDTRDQVRFLEINPVTARLVELIRQQETMSGRAALEKIAGELRHPDPGVVVDGGRAILDDLRRRDILLGGRRVE